MVVGTLIVALVAVSVLLFVVSWAVWSAVAAAERSKRHPDRRDRPGRAGPRQGRGAASWSATPRSSRGGVGEVV
jgi:hypothetical protein